MWMGEKGTQPSEMKIYPHPVQNKQAMTWKKKEKKKNLQKTNNFPVKLRCC